MVSSKVFDPAFGRLWDAWNHPGWQGDHWHVGNQPWHRKPVCRRTGCARPATSFIVQLCPGHEWDYHRTRLGPKPAWWWMA
jgi:hypothetical protein